MKYYVQYEQTITSAWSSEEGKYVPIKPEQWDMLGSDGVYILDGRNSLETMKQDAQERWGKLEKRRMITGYRIVKAERFTDPEVVLYAVRKINIKYKKL